MLTFTVVSRHENRLCRLHVFNLRYIIYTLYVVACQYRKTGVCMCVSGGGEKGIGGSKYKFDPTRWLSWSWFCISYKLVNLYLYLYSICSISTLKLDFSCISKKEWNDFCYCCFTSPVQVLLRLSSLMH